MATIQVGGRTVTVSDDFNSLPDDQKAATVREIAASMKPGVVEDVAKSAGTGVMKGVIGLGGLVGDAQELIGMGIDKVLRPRTPEAKDAPSLLPTSKGITDAVQSVTGEFYKPQTTAGEYAQTVGEFAPAIVAGPGGILRRGVQQVAMPGVASEAAGQATKGTPYEPYARLGAAVAAPAALPAAARAITPIPSSPERQRMVQTMANEGVELTAGQQTGSRPLRFAESHLTEIPGGGGAAAAIGERQKEQFTSAALRRAGENAPRATPDVINNAFTRIGHEFDNLSANNTLHADQVLATDLADTARNYFSLVNPSARAPVVEATLNDIINGVRASGGTLTGESYQALRSRLDRMARASRNDPQLQDALFGIRTAMDDAMERSMIAAGRQADVDAWRNARREYRNLLVIERAAAGAGEDAAMGLLSPAQMRGATVGQNKRDYVRGDGDFAELVRAANATMLPMPNSGTPGRLATQVIPGLIGGTIGSVAGPGGIAPGALAASALAAAVPPMMGRAIMSPLGRAYLGNQAIPALQAPTRGERTSSALVRALSTRPQLESQ